MLDIPSQLKNGYARLLTQRNIPSHSHNHYLRWLRFYLDFCNKYHHDTAHHCSATLFISKLKEKNQTPRQQEQASHAINLYYALENIDYIKDKANQKNSLKDTAQKSSPALTPEEMGWEQIFTDLDAAIRVRHYSPKTYKTYASWTRQFQYFTKEKAPELLTADDVKLFLTNLAVREKVAASTQNQAFNALLFLFRHILHRDYFVEGVVRAKQRKYIPVVLSREEIDSILEHLSYPYDLVVKLLYGCGLRLFECLQLRINRLNFDAMILTVHDGKGQKDRTVPLPTSIFRGTKKPG
jgi:hypothetical protein